VSTERRACGECTGCCFLPAVPALGKPVCTLCVNARGAAGCAIYAERPRECREYSCLWLSSDLGEAGDRPDHVGLMFDRPTLVHEHPDYAGIPFVCARELRDGARDEARAAELLLRFSRSWVVRLTALDGRTQLLGPRSLVDQLVARARARA
jgi:hypothetical protein